MHEMKRGELKSGRSGKKVKSRKQAIAIGLSEARSSGAKVPKPEALQIRTEPPRGSAAQGGRAGDGSAPLLFRLEPPLGAVIYSPSVPSASGDGGSPYVTT